MKLEYIATNEKGEEFIFYAYGIYTATKHNLPNARDWIIAHCDLSENWTYRPTGNFKHDEFNKNPIITNQGD